MFPVRIRAGVRIAKLNKGSRMLETQDQPPSLIDGLDLQAVAGLKALFDEHPRFAVPDPSIPSMIGEFAFSNRVKSPSVSQTEGH